jgi:23S rRNA pseudouridine1911/1915/1917 synthase
MSVDKRPTDVDFIVEADQDGQRLDVFLTNRLESTSRSQLRRAIDDGLATMGGRSLKRSTRIKTGQCVTFSIPDPPPPGPKPEDIPLDVLYEDDQLVIVNKPAGMVVHPSIGHWDGTLASALVFHFQELSDAGGSHRPGIVHRLDRDTSGCIVVAKNNMAHAQLSGQFAERRVSKSYLAIVIGSPDCDRDVIKAPIGMHPKQREKMAVRKDHSTSRAAESFYEVQNRFARHSLLEIQPRTGRTHQIRVHLAHIGHPVLCDSVYGHQASFRESDLKRDYDGNKTPVLLNRQALHATSLGFDHPTTGEPMLATAPLPEDMQVVLELLKR